MVINYADWARDFGILIENRFSTLRRTLTNRSEETAGQSFELGPRPSFAHNLYIECRWAPHCELPEVRETEIRCARVTLQLRKRNSAVAEPLASKLRALKLVSSDSPLDVRVAPSGNTIYLTRGGLPELDLAIAATKQSETIKAYGEACILLQDLWRSRCNSLVDEFC